MNAVGSLVPSRACVRAPPLSQVWIKHCIGTLMPLADYATIICTGAGICARGSEISPGDRSGRRECAYVALSAMKLQMQLRGGDAAKRRRRYPPWRDRRRLGSAETTPGAEVAIIMSYLRPIPSGICHSPPRTSHLASRLIMIASLPRRALSYPDGSESSYNIRVITRIIMRIN